MTLFYLALAWLAGIAFAPQVNVSWLYWLIPCGLSIVGLLLAGKHYLPRLSMSCCLLLSLGAMRFQLAQLPPDDSHIQNYNGQGFQTLEGIIIDAPDIRDTHTNLRVRVENIVLQDDILQPAQGRILVQAPRNADYRYGTPVRISGELELPPEFDGFSYRDYLARQDIHSMMRYARVEITGERRGNPIRAAMLDFRTSAHQSIRQLLPDPQAALLAGILLGIESDISPDVRTAFDTVDATHVIAISGSNLVILAGLISSVLRRFLRDRWVTLGTIVGVLCYAIFVGGDAAVLRAAVMTTLALTASQLGRQTYGFASLGFAALLMTAINPLLLTDLGFQLSFLATLGLILYVDPLQELTTRWLSRITSSDTAQKTVGALSDALLVTIAVQITIRPIMAYYFGRFSLVSLPVNLLIVPLQTPLMVLGGLGVLASFLFWPLGQVITWGSWLFLSATLGIVRFFASLPFASVEITTISKSTVWGIYIVIFSLTALLNGSQQQRQQHWEWFQTAAVVKTIGAVGLIITGVIFAAILSTPDDRLHVTFIDVGDGQATLIETPSGRQILIDAGGSGRKLSTAIGDSLPFWDRKLDVLVLSGQGARQLAGGQSLLDRYSFDAVLTASTAPLSEHGLALFQALEASGATLVTMQPGHQISIDDDVTLTALYVSPSVSGAEDDAVLLLEYDSARILITGDLSPEAESYLLAHDAYLLDAAVLQVPHSGHSEVSSEAFLAAVNPQIAVLAVNEGNRFNLPHAETLGRLQALDAPLYRTDQSGNVHIITDGDQLWVKPAR